MFRPLSSACLVLALALAGGALPLPAAAQASRAYAPENLRQLPVPDRVRVIEREYSDQSGGRAIPDDQLEFYLDQVNSGWGFNQVRHDIGVSLRGGTGGGLRPGAGWGGWNGSQWTGQTVICSSNDRRRRECRTPFSGRPALVENISGTRCIEGVSFGGAGGVKWVDQGCRGRFTQARGGWNPGPGTGQVVRCESQNNRERVCPVNFRNRAVLVRQLSGARCIEGQTWGQRGNSIWVRNGCRGEFAEGRGGNWGGGTNPNFSVTCSSDNSRRRTCAWDSRQGRPVVIQQLSGTRCQESSNWGWDGRSTIWVDRGCRARFGAR
jgi:hypothetical protein